MAILFREPPEQLAALRYPYRLRLPLTTLELLVAVVVVVVVVGRPPLFIKHLNPLLSGKFDLAAAVAVVDDLVLPQTELPEQKALMSKLMEGDHSLPAVTEAQVQTLLRVQAAPVETALRPTPPTPPNLGSAVVAVIGVLLVARGDQVLRLMVAPPVVSAAAVLEALFQETATSLILQQEHV
jgi:hypothetical protein